MKKWSLYIILTLLSLNIFSQNCSIFSKANNITPDKLCSPVTASWNVTYTGVNDAGTTVQIMYNWDDGTAVTIPATQAGTGIFQDPGRQEMFSVRLRQDWELILFNMRQFLTNMDVCHQMGSSDL